jgi:outer membrane lipoprotein-sorting protein
MRQAYALLFSALLLALAVPGYRTAFAADSLEAALAKMDQASAGFKGLTADMAKTSFTAVISQSSVDEGSMVVKRPKPKDLRMLVDFRKPDPKVVAVQGRKVEVFYPKINTVQEFDAGKNRNLLDQFLLLGFGSTSADLKSAYTLKYVGQETIAGQKSSRIELIPRSKEVLVHLKRVELWLSDSSGLPVRQKFHMPGGDYTEATFTNVKLAPNLPDSAVKLNLPKGVKRETPQK